MKKIFILLNFLGIIALGEAQIGINTSTPSNAAVLDLNSHLGGTNYGGFMPPRVSLTERDLIPVTSADDGLMVYVSGFVNGDRCLQLFNGSTMEWETIQCFAAAPPVPPVPTTVFVETMGTVSIDTNVNTHQVNSGFSNSGLCPTCILSSTTPQSQIRIASPSDTSGASGLGNLYFASNSIRDFIIQGIDVTAYAGPLTLQLLISKGTTGSNGSEIAVDYYDTATSSWVAMPFSDLPTGAGTTIWYEKVLATNVPNTISGIRISTNGTNPYFRIDDIKIIKP